MQKPNHPKSEYTTEELLQDAKAASKATAICALICVLIAFIIPTTKSLQEQQLAIWIIICISFFNINLHVLMCAIIQYRNRSKL